MGYLIDIENSIIGQIKTKITDIYVGVAPDTQVEFQRLPIQNGAILVTHKQNAYKAPYETDAMYQSYDAQFDITIITRDLRSHAGAYAYQEKVRDALVGFKPSITGMSPAADAPMFLIREAFVGYTQKSLWVYSSLFGITLLNAKEGT
jgi:hypothetical protein